MLDENQRDITILCKVVDNFGDIGVCSRLARAILEVCPEVNIRLVVSDLSAFSALDCAVDREKAEQRVHGIWIYDWNDGAVCTRAFLQKKPKIILECFECGRPDWLEEILFARDNTDIAHIINLEYLTAEEWADEFHTLKSGTRSAFIKKANFMPGFSKNTGGLILDNHFMKCCSDTAYARDFLMTEANLVVKESDFNVVIFSYERDFSPVVKSLSSFADNFADKSGKSVRVFLTAGKSRKSFLRAVTKEYLDRGKNLSFYLTKLKFLSQEVWDALLTVCDFNFVRGEDSLSRAVLAGAPFAWHAYPQADEQQLVKAEALMARMKPFFSRETAALFGDFTAEYNRDNPSAQKQENLLSALFSRCEELSAGCTAFAKTIIKNGNLAENLLNYISGLQF